jgi:hypothetical protein
VKANNSCVRTLIFGSFFLLPFVKFFSLPLFCFFGLTFYCIFSFFIWFFYRSLFSPYFLAHVVSSLTYPTCLGIKWLVVVVVLNIRLLTKLSSQRISQIVNPGIPRLIAGWGGLIESPPIDIALGGSRISPVEY